MMSVAKAGLNFPKSTLLHASDFYKTANPYSVNAFSWIRKILDEPGQPRIVTANAMLLGAFHNIFTNQALIAERTRMIAGPMLPFPLISAAAVIQGALGELSRKITSSALWSSDFGGLEILNDLTAKAEKITAEILPEKQVTQANVQRMEGLLVSGFEGIMEHLNDRARSRRELIGFWIGFLSFLLAVLIPLAQKYFINENDKPVTKQDIRGLQESLTTKWDSLLNKLAAKRVVKFTCALRFKPTNRSQWLYTLRAGTEVAVLSTNHKWVNVSFIDPVDFALVSGWILKKYVSQSPLQRS
jgi:hypothetical protein